MKIQKLLIFTYCNSVTTGRKKTYISVIIIIILIDSVLVSERVCHLFDI